MPHVLEHVINRLDRAIQPQRAAQFFERGIGLPGDQVGQLLAMRRRDFGLAPRLVVTRGKSSGVRALLDQLLDHPQRDHKRVGNLLA
jgi:hypothetical protein